MTPRASLPSSARRPAAAARPAPGVALLLALLLALGAAGCSRDFARGQALEEQGRWEEAMQAYRAAVVDDPDDAEYREALERAENVVARDNFERYRTYLAEKAFRKAYDRLQAAARQDPTYAPVQAELAKWTRVLVGGQVRFDFATAQTSITLADEITLMVRLNTPNPGETLDAEVDIDTGTFFAEDLLYDRPAELLALYSVNAIGVDLVFGRTRIKQFTTREFQRFINIRTPIVDDVNGAMRLDTAAARTPVAAHRERLPQVAVAGQPAVPPSSPRYSLRIRGDRIVVDTAQPGVRPDFTPRFLYVNRRERRAFVDFGRYEVSLRERGGRWTLRRLPLEEADYFSTFARNIALQPYFFYREGVFTYVPARPG